MKRRIAVIGAGISGVSSARIMGEKYDVTVFERKNSIGGLISCDNVNGAVYHKVGGHVFNSKNKKVFNWFWNHFDRKSEFKRIERNAKIFINDALIGYPIENYLYQLPPDICKEIILELQSIKDNKTKSENFEEFLINNFGTKLYELYFKPYNQKMWRTDLSKIPLEWLQGKLPMPNLSEIIISNILREEERNMVHSNFYYPKQGGSQFIIDRLSEGVSIEKNVSVDSISHVDDKFLINDTYFDYVIYTGDVRELREMFMSNDSNIVEALNQTCELQTNGTTNFLCETDSNDLSWLYFPEEKYLAHRIIYTGNFSEWNNGNFDRRTCVVEFSGFYEESEMKNDIAKLPGNLNPIAHNYEPNSYVIQNQRSAGIIERIKNNFESKGLFLVGRFAEWQYYNMDKCIESAFKVKDIISERV